VHGEVGLLGGETRLPAVRPGNRSLFPARGKRFLSLAQHPDRLNGPPGTAGIKQPGYDAEHCSPSIAQFRNAWSYTSTAAYALMVWYVIKHGSHGSEYEINVVRDVTPCVYSGRKVAAFRDNLLPVSSG
jgi:hypothetical protein